MLACLSSQVLGLGTPAGTVINTTATLSFQASSGSQQSVTSNTASVAVLPAPQVTLSPQSGALVGQPGQVVYQAVTLTNLGNLTDTFDISLISGWPADLLLDDGAGGGIARDGTHQPGENNVCPSSVTLAANARLALLVAHTLPASGTGSDTVQMKVVSRADPSVLANGSYQATVVGSSPSISGVVKDMQTSAAISGAAVKISQSGTAVVTVTTDASGFYSAALSAGTYDLLGSASGHTWTWIGGISVTAGNTTVVDILLSQSRFQGAVTDAATGLPVAGATVKALQSGVVKYSTTTSLGGNYWLNLVPGSYTLQVSQTGYGTQSLNDSVVAGQVRIENFALAPLGISGVVKDMQTSAAISGATVKISQSGTVVATVTTDASGFYSAALSAGAYDLVGSASGHAASWIGGISVTAGNTTVVDILLSQSRFQGTVTNAATGSPVAGATVKGIQSGVVKYSTTTSSAGNYWLNLVPGSYTLEVSQTGYATQSLDRAISAGQVQVQNFALSLAPAPTPTPTQSQLFGYVTRAVAGQPLAGAAVQALLPDGTRAASTTTDSNGRYWLTLASGSYTIRTSLSGYTTKDLSYSLSPDQFGRLDIWLWPSN